MEASQPHPSQQRAQESGRHASEKGYGTDQAQKIIRVSEF
jgi:hypothetical protein